MNALRKGMWVRHGDKVGILAEFRTVTKKEGEILSDKGSSVVGAEIHYVDEKGLTKEKGFAPLTGLAQSSFDDIPKARRPSEKMATELGYLRI